MLPYQMQALGLIPAFGSNDISFGSSRSDNSWQGPQMAKAKKVSDDLISESETGKHSASLELVEGTADAPNDEKSELELLLEKLEALAYRIECVETKLQDINATATSLSAKVIDREFGQVDESGGPAVGDEPQSENTLTHPETRADLEAELRRIDILEAAVETLSQGTVSPGGFEPTEEALASINAETARSLNLLPLSIKGSTLTCASASPEDEATIRELSFITNFDIHLVETTQEQVDAGIAAYYKSADDVGPDLQ